MPEYRFRPKARADIEHIWDYTYQTWGTRQARHYLRALRDVCADLAKHPDMGRIRDDLCAGLRVYPSGKHLVFYLIEEDGIDIVRGLHERMDSQFHLP